MALKETEMLKESLLYLKENYVMIRQQENDMTKTSSVFFVNRLTADQKRRCASLSYAVSFEDFPQNSRTLHSN